MDLSASSQTIGVREQWIWMVGELSDVLKFWHICVFYARDVCVKFLTSAPEWLKRRQGSTLALFTRNLKRFYEQKLLNRRPSRAEMMTIEEKYGEVGFVDWIGAIDCIKLNWKDRQFALNGKFQY